MATESAKKRYYLSALSLPILIPIVFMLFPDFSATPLLIFSLVFGGVAYLVFVIGVLYFGRQKDGDWYRRLSYFAPIIYAPIQSFTVLIWFWVEGAQDIFSMQGMSVISLFMFWSIIIGYLYVSIITIVYELFVNRNVQP